MLKPAVLLLALAGCASANAASSVCEKTKAAERWVKGAVVSGAAAAGLGAGAVGTASTVGITAVAHSSGAWILTGSAGYMAGTMGAAAGAVAAAPIVLAGGVLIAGGAGTALYLCRDK
jgi:hypothetical protein